MGFYRKIPVEVEARQHLAGKSDDVATWCGGRVSIRDGQTKIVIATLEGAMKADIGDYVIKGVKGEFYPCKPDIFESTYEPVNPDDGFEAVAGRNHGTIKSTDIPERVEIVR